MALLHENITRRRVAAGLSRREFAERLGVTERQWWRMETDRIRIAAAEMPRIAKALNTTVAALYRPRPKPAAVDMLLDRRRPERARRQDQSPQRPAGEHT